MGYLGDKNNVGLVQFLHANRECLLLAGKVRNGCNLAGLLH